MGPHAVQMVGSGERAEISEEWRLNLIFDIGVRCLDWWRKFIRGELEENHGGITTEDLLLDHGGVCMVVMEGYLVDITVIYR